MAGFDWDEDTKEENGYWQYGYDGEDFLSFDLKTQTWIALVQQAVMSKHKLDNDKALTTQVKNYLTQICPELLKKYLKYGRSYLMRTGDASQHHVTAYPQSSSSPITCHSTGFYPHRAEMVWKKDGEELHEGVHKGEILPNHDGTFQMSVDLDLSAGGYEDWDRYSCVFQLSGVSEEITTKLDKAGIGSNEGETEIRGDKHGKHIFTVSCNARNTHSKKLSACAHSNKVQGAFSYIITCKHVSLYDSRNADEEEAAVDAVSPAASSPW
uniref:Ig-like domain-containing protein n=1 Tax=Amphilophus citrinellus TaxID=61819 RepID=A0A3Q0R7U9_AMPCI